MLNIPRQGWKKDRAAMILLHVCAMFLLSLIDLKTRSHLCCLLLEANRELTLQLLTLRHTNEQEMFVYVFEGGCRAKESDF